MKVRMACCTTVSGTHDAMGLRKSHRLQWWLSASAMTLASLTTIAFTSGCSRSQQTEQTPAEDASASAPSHTTLPASSPSSASGVTVPTRPETIVEGTRQPTDEPNSRTGSDLTNAISAAASIGTYDAYQSVIARFPDQQELICFDGGIGPFIETIRDLNLLCPLDRPHLEKTAAAQGLPPDRVGAFFGLFVYPPPTQWRPHPEHMSLDEHQAMLAQNKREDCFAIPQWAARDMKLLTQQPLSGERGTSGQVIEPIGESHNKVFSFVGAKCGDRYRIVAARLVRVLHERPPLSSTETSE